MIDEKEFNQDIPISRIYEKIHQRIINNVNLHKRAIELVYIHIIITMYILYTLSIYTSRNLFLYTYRTNI